MSSEGTPLHGDRSAWNIMDFDPEHAKDIMDSTLRRHLPLPGAAGGIAQSDGTDWQRVSSLPLADIASYSRGYIIRGGSSDWEAYDASTSGFILVGDGTDIASVCFDWDTMAGGASADMVHAHTSNAEGGTITVAAISDIATTYLKLDASNDPITGALDLTYTFVNATGDEEALKITTTDNVAQTANMHRSLVVAHAVSAAKTSTASVEGISSDIALSAATQSVYGYGAYISESGNNAHGNIFGMDIYLENMGSGGFANLVGLNIGINSTNTGSSRHAGLRIRNHSGTATDAIIVESAFVDGLDLDGATFSGADIRLSHGHTIADGASAITLNTNLSISGNIAVTGTVDGVDVAAHASQHNAGGADALGTVPNHDHTGDAGDGAQISHDSALADISADDHHSETHTIVSTGPHAETGLTIGHFLKATGATAFSFAAIAAGDLPTAIDAAKIADGSVNNTEFQYLDDYATIGLVDLATAEVDQLENIASTTISAAQWGYLGLTNQGLASTDSPTFNALTATSIVIGANTITTTEWANLDGLDQTIATSSSPTFASLTISGATGANVITIPDNLADALHLSDADGIEYMRIVSTDAQPIVKFNNGGADVDFIVEAVGQANAFNLRGSDGHIGIGYAPSPQRYVYLRRTITDPGAAHYAMQVRFSATATGNNAQSLYAMTFSMLTANVAHDFGTLYGVQGIVGHTGSGTLSEGRAMWAGTRVTGDGDITTAYGLYVHSGLSGGTGDIGTNYGVYVKNPIGTGGGTITGTNYALYLENQTRGATNYAIYAAGGNSYHGGRFAVGGTVAALAQMHVDQSVNDAAIPALILDQADISEGFINFIGSDRGVITGATNSLESVRVEIGGVVRRLALYVDA